MLSKGFSTDSAVKLKCKCFCRVNMTVRLQTLVSLNAMSQDLSKPVIHDRVFLDETNSAKIRGLFVFIYKVLSLLIREYAVFLPCR